MNKLLILTGASGSGKTVVLNHIKEHSGVGFTEFLKYDSIGVPTTDEMIKEAGTIENWQRVKTIEWLDRIKTEYTSNENIIFEGQMRIAFINEALEKCNINNAKVILLDCNDEVRYQRLKADRKQPELANENMLNWANYLRNEAKETGATIIDNSDMTVDETAEAILGSR